MLFAWIEERAKNMWHEASTWIGIVITAVSSIAPHFAQFDPRIAWAGAVAGVILMVKKGSGSGKA